MDKGDSDVTESSGHCLDDGDAVGHSGSGLELLPVGDT